MTEEDAEASDALNSTWGYTEGDPGDPNDPNGNTGSGGSPPSLEKVRATVRDKFDERIWEATEAVLTAQATLLLADIEACMGLVIDGPPGTGKTTALRFLEDASYGDRELIYKCDDFTHAAFVSHDTSKEEDELAENDLLPEIRHRTLVAPDMNPWFSGSEESVRNNMSYLARVMDGNGLKRNTGGHGQRGYEGDYRFALIAATTPLEPRAWDVMGNVGQRLLFHEMTREDDIDVVSEDIFGETDYSEKVTTCQATVSEFLSNLWSTHGGYGGANWDTTPSPEVQEAITYLANFVVHARAPVVEIDGETEPQREGAHRVMMALRNLARGHALLRDRHEIEIKDVELCARVALSTMHRKRRGTVRAVVDPDTPTKMKTSEILNHKATGAAKNTILQRMELLDALEIGGVMAANQGRQTRTFTLFDEFVWPDQLPFPV